MFKQHMRMMMVTAASLACLSGAVATASADGYERRAIAAPCCAFSWSGFYVGMNGGYAWSDDQTVHISETFSPLAVAPAAFFSGNFGSLSPSGGFGGIQVGGNVQIGAVVLGFEADGQWADISDSSLGTITPYLGPGTSTTVGTSNKVNRFGTLRPRLGLAWDRTLLYATGGLAWGRVDHTLTWKDSFGFTSFDRSTGIQVGYVVGGGVEHAFTPHLSLKVEYQYINLGSEHYVAQEQFGGVAGGFLDTTDTRTDFHTVRLGLNWKLGK